MAERSTYPLPRFSVRRPVTVIMLLVALLVVGAVAYSRIPLALFPEGLDFPRLYIWVPYPNASPIEVDGSDMIRGKKVLVVEDGPTLTHGEMAYGAGVVAAEKFGAAELVDPRPYAVKSIAETFRKYPDIGILLPAMGYGAKQVKDLETTINRTKCDLVIVATPIDLNRLIKIKKPTVRVFYRLQEIGFPSLTMVLEEFVKNRSRRTSPGKRSRR